MPSRKMIMLVSLAAMFLIGCNNARFMYVNEPDTPQLCTVVEQGLLCSDGQVYVIPPHVDCEEGEVVETEPTDETDPDAICEKDNRNKKKCKKIKREKK